MASKYDPKKASQVEKDVKDTFDVLVEEGIDKTTAAKYVLITHPKATKGFTEWLSDGTLTKVEGKVQDKEPAA